MKYGQVLERQVTTLLIIIIDRISLIGVLKAIGANDWSIRRIFLYSSTNLLIKGLFLGNIFAFVFAFLQSKFSIISLDPDTYYMKTVPINIDIGQIEGAFTFGLGLWTSEEIKFHPLTGKILTYDTWVSFITEFLSKIFYKEKTFLLEFMISIIFRHINLQCIKTFQRN